MSKRLLYSTELTCVAKYNTMPGKLIPEPHALKDLFAKGASIIIES